MITELFIIFLIISFALIAVGKYLKQPPIVLAGYLFLFILGITLLTGGLVYSTGGIVNNSYVCACCNGGIYTEGGVSYDYFCIGTPNNCDYYDLNEVACIGAGCIYDNETLSCSGTPSDCDTFFIQRDCEAVACEWLPGQEPNPSCENGTITLKNTTTIKAYTSYDNEIIEGIQIHHILGFFLVITAIFGWVITLTDLESFQPESLWKKEP
jgi:hypothetical protein